MRIRHRIFAVFLATALVGTAGCGEKGPMDMESQETSEKAYVMENVENVQQIEPTRIIREESQAPQAVQLDVPELLQKPELPTGCESVALTMALLYEGYDLEKTTIADEYLVYSEDGDFTRGYVGDPKSRQGAGCFPPTIVETANSYLAEQGAGKVAEDVTGTDFEVLLEKYLAEGIPVILWHTMYMSEPEFTEEIYERNGIAYSWYSQEHCVVLSGYDMEQNTVTVNDPLEGIIERDMDEFQALFEQTGKFAVVIK